MKTFKIPERLSKPTFNNLPINHVLYDKNNPREYSYWIDEVCRQGKISKQQFNDQFGHYVALADSDHAGEGYERVYEAVSSVGFIIQPIICIKIKKDKFLCIEGNTRLAIYNSLHLEELEKNVSVRSSRWQSIPALTFEQLSQDVINTIRMISHFRTSRSWTPGNVAKFIHEQLRDDNQEDIAKMTGIKTAELWDYKNAWELFEKHALSESKMKEERPVFKNFSIWIEAASKGEVQETIKNKGGFGQLYRWIKGNNFQRAEHIRSLPIIAKSKEAWSIFLKKDSRQALLYLGLKDEESISIFDAIKRFEDRLLKWKGGSVKREGNYGEIVYSRLKSLTKTIKSVFERKQKGPGKIARNRK